MGSDHVPEFDPAAVLDRIGVETERLLGNASRLTDADMRAPSLLPGWSRGHVMTHIAHNADGGTRLLGWARTGVEAAEYSSLEARASEIEAGSGRSATDLVTDVRESAERFAATYAAMPSQNWQHIVRWTAGQEHPAFRAADARLTEVLLHHVDLDAGFTPADWPADFASDMLRRVIASFANRKDAPGMRLQVDGTGIEHSVSRGGPGPAVRGSSTSLLAWAMGRSDGSDLTVEGGTLPIPPFLY